MPNPDGTSTIDEFIARARPDLAKVRGTGVDPKDLSRLMAPPSGGLSAGDIPVIVLVDKKTGQSCDPIGMCEDFFKEDIEQKHMREIALGDAFAKLKNASERGNPNYENGKVFLFNTPLLEVFEKWHGENPHWFFKQGTSGGAAAAFGPGRTITGVADRLKELGDDMEALMNEAESWGLDRHTLYNLKVEGVPPTGFKEQFPEHDHSNPRNNPWLTLRNSDGTINPSAEKRIASIYKMKDGGRLAKVLIESARKAGYNSSGFRIR